ncbi:HAD-superfamily hydrolase, subfamily IA, variant 3 [Coriobacterium glomerans PW2]|uniref:HAD-superfamily hydrolase, subfamily IA, variant 3 n=1 Tax=Coriobacterium glomerans (strain ATCC 49209 / DSM 20642 / JCM 10262 / PW2) TaxID=700015 RepID=F2NA04_CORGP|nr:HAD family hydrolase [Coriobacterium glomerans]AEB06259.1 HAD-superfamily hydrolase, subfamily IA, variant 3 [Coriobacterium glomerans PW2]
MTFSHVIFDLDGTLLDTLEDLAGAANHVCRIHGWPTFPVDAYRHMVGNGVRRLAERFMPPEVAGNRNVLEEVLEEFRAWYADHGDERTRPYPGVLEMLDDIAAEGVDLAVLTNKDHAAAVPLVERYFGSRFALVQGQREGISPKPAPDATLGVLRALGAAPSDALYIGDSDVDVATGHNAGLIVAGAAWGFRGRVELETSGADLIVEQPREVAAIALG